MTNKSANSQFDKLGVFSLAVEQTADTIVITDAKGNIEYVNPAFQEITGYSIEEVLGKTPRILKSGLHPDEAYNAMWETILAGKTHRSEIKNKKKNGEIYVESKTITPIKDSQGKITHFVAMGTDITRRIAAEHELHLAQFALDHAGDAVYRVTSEGCFDYVNDEACQSLGYSRDELLTMGVADINPDYPKERWLGTLDRIKKEGSLTLETNHKRKDGTLFPVEVSTNYLRYNDREYTCSIVRDITERKKAEEALKASERDLRELYDNATEGIFRTTADGRVLYANKALLDMLGYENEEELLSVNVGDMFVEPDKRKELYRQYVSDDRILNHDFQLRKKNGDVVWVRENSRIVRDEQGAVQYYEGFNTDITALKQLESELLRNQKLESLGVLAAGLAHDFNNFLMTIMMNINSAQARVSKNAAVHENLAAAVAAIRHAGTITRQLFTLARKNDSLRDTILLTPLLKESVKFALHGSNVKPEFVIAEDLWRVDIDSGQINQVINNLAINAVQAMPDGGKIIIVAENRPRNGSDIQHDLQHGDYVKVSLEDNGPGIPEEIVGKVFDPYFTTKEQGSGLGLFSCYKIAKDHGGLVTAQSEVGKGATFTLYLPAAETKTESTSVSEVSQIQHRKILIINNDETYSRGLKEMLEGKGYSIDIASGEEQAIEHVKDCQKTNDPCEIALISHGVTGGDNGLEVFKHIRAVGPDIKGILSTANPGEPSSETLEAYGLSGALYQPFSADDLERMIQNVLS